MAQGIGQLVQCTRQLGADKSTEILHEMAQREGGGGGPQRAKFLFPENVQGLHNVKLRVYCDIT